MGTGWDGAGRAAIPGEQAFTAGDNAALAASATFTPKCAKLLKPFRAKDVPLSATGSRDVNQLVKALGCQCEATNACRDLIARYEACHSEVIGGGAMDGRLHCTPELKELLACVSKP